ncbi:MAG TPA: alpha/beta hydrolase [Thermoanaerobaculia bacterium]|jgi:acetyl esterase/lipase
MKTTLRVALALSLIAAAARNADAQTTWQPAGGHKQIVLWPNGPPDPRPGVGVEGLHYALTGEAKQKKLVGGKPYMYIENVTQPTVTVFPAAKKNGATPAVIVYPGGGFNVLAIDIEGTEICDWLLSNGIACALLKYRVPCEHQGPYRECPPAHVDAQRAMSIVRSRAAEWRIDPNKIGVIGFSAGAHMAIMASTRFDRLYPAIDDADKTSSRPDFALVLYPGRVASKRMNFTPNPDIQVTDRTSPTFLVHAYNDPMNPVENSLTYAAALRKAGVPAEIHIFANGGHAFGLRRVASTATAWAPLAEAWLKAIGVIGQ